MYYYMTIKIPFDALEGLLNSIESHASGVYDIIAVIPLTVAFLQVGVAIRFKIEETDPPFDEEEIKRKLGIED